MRDPYDLLGVARGASFDEIKAAYRRACKSAHPDMPGGSNEKMVELGTAYAFILSELKKGYAQQQQQDAKQQQAPGQEETWQDVGSPLSGQTYSSLMEGAAAFFRVKVLSQ